MTQQEALEAQFRAVLVEFVESLREYLDQEELEESDRYDAAHEELMKLVKEVATPTGSVKLDHTMSLLRTYATAFEKAWLLAVEMEYELDDDYQQPLDDLCAWIEQQFM